MADEWKEQYDYYFDKVNNANVESAKKQMEFQERMSSTAHEREIADLAKAGLNPVLSANNGASSPMGAYASVDSSAISAKFARQNLEKELENARTITAMQNSTQMQIAMAQMANQMELGKYTVDTQTKTQRFDTIVQEYGLLAGLAYGLAEGMYNGDTSLESSVKSVLDTGGQINSVWDLYNTAKNASQKGIDTAQNTLDKGYAVLNDHTYDPDTVISKGTNPNSKFANLVNSLATKAKNFIYNTSPSDYKKPPQYKKYKTKHGNGHARSF